MQDVHGDHSVKARVSKRQVFRRALRHARAARDSAGIEAESAAIVPECGGVRIERDDGVPNRANISDENPAPAPRSNTRSSGWQWSNNRSVDNSNKRRNPRSCVAGPIGKTPVANGSLLRRCSMRIPATGETGFASAATRP